MGGGRKSFAGLKCIICKDKSVQNLETLFQFPKCPERRDKWIANMKLQPSQVKKLSRVCMIHFNKSQLVRDRLKKDAVPTLFPVASSSNCNDNSKLLQTISTENIAPPLQLLEIEQVNNFVPFIGATLPMSMSTMYIIKPEEAEISASSENSSSPPSSCVVCHRRCRCSSNRISLLKTQTDLQFLLLNILGFPSKSLEDYKKEFGAPQNWIPLCSQCLDVIKEGRQIHEQISQLKKHLRARNDLILEKVMDTYYCPHENLSESLQKARKLIDSFLRAHQQRLKEEEVEDNVSQSQNFIHVPSPSSPHSSVKEEEDNDETKSGGESDDVDNYDANEDYVEKMLQEDLSSSMSTREEEKKDPLLEGDDDDDVIVLQPKTKWQKRTRAQDDFYRRKRGFRYCCPNCPKITTYSLNRYVQHLSIHQRRPYRCNECYEFLPPEEDKREQHWKDKHAEKELPSDTEKFIEIKFDAGRIYKCDGCLDGFLTQEERNGHESKCKIFLENRKQLESKRVSKTCSTCQQSSRNTYEWRLHRAILHPEVDSLSCFNCDLSFAEKTADSGLIVRNDLKLATEHLLVENKSNRKRWHGAGGSVFYAECELCGIVFGGGGAGGKFPRLKDHMVKIHGIPALKAFSCRICHRGFSTSSSVKFHIATKHFPPEKLPPTPTYSKAKSMKSIKLSIQRQKTAAANNVAVVESKRYFCELCAKRCKNSTELRIHQLTHRNKNIKTFMCDLCGKFLRTSNTLQVHRQTIHFNRPEMPPIVYEFDPKRPFQCRYCQKGFINRQRVRRHEQGHENKISKPFKCEECGSSFAVLDNLKGHKRLFCGEGKGKWRERNWKGRYRRNETTKGSESIPSTSAAASSSSIPVSVPIQETNLPELTTENDEQVEN